MKVVKKYKHEEENGRNTPSDPEVIADHQLRAGRST